MQRLPKGNSGGREKEGILSGNNYKPLKTVLQEPLKIFFIQLNCMPFGRSLREPRWKAGEVEGRGRPMS